MRTLFRVCFLILLLVIIEIVCAGISALGVLLCAGHSAFTLKISIFLTCWIRTTSKTNSHKESTFMRWECSILPLRPGFKSRGTFLGSTERFSSSSPISSFHKDQQFFTCFLFMFCLFDLLFVCFFHDSCFQTFACILVRQSLWSLAGTQNELS